MESLNRPIQLVFKRTEAKYLLDCRQKERLCALMGEWMVPDEFGATTIRNLYLDTPSLLLARRSAEHPLYKEKLRIRSYAAAGTEDEVFLELKKKYDGVVYKRRCRMKLKDALALCQGRRRPRGQIQEELAYSALHDGGIGPVAQVAYEREAFFGRDDRDLRLTFDHEVRARWEHLNLVSAEGTPLIASGCFLLEIKTPKAMPLWLVAFLSEEQLRKTSFSKYGEAARRHLAGLPSQGARLIPFPEQAASETVSGLAAERICHA